MSRGFVKEGDQEEVPLVTPRPHLPPGVENYVTSQGLQALKEEREQLQQERSQYSGQMRDLSIFFSFSASKTELEMPNISDK